MTVATVLILVALAASIYLFLHKRSLFAIIALAASGLQALVGFKVFQLGLKGVPLELILGAALVGSGVMLYLGVSGKRHVAAATALTLVGAIQLMTALL